MLEEEVAKLEALVWLAPARSHRAKLWLVQGLGPCSLQLSSAPGVIGIEPQASCLQFRMMPKGGRVNLQSNELVTCIKFNVRC